MTQYFARMDRAGFDAVATVAFDDVDGTVLDELRAARVVTHLLPSRRRHPLKYMLALRRLIRKNGYDSVHVNGNSGTVAIDLLSLMGVGVRVRIVHSHNTQSGHKTLDKLLKPIMLLLSTDRLACGRDAGVWMFGAHPFKVIPNGRDFDLYSFAPGTRDRVRRELDLSDEHIAVGHVGAFNAAKNHRFLLEAFALARSQNRRLRLFLIGDGILRSDIEESVRSLGLSMDVALLGRSPRVPEYMSAFDLLVLPSRHEGLPNVVIEAQISGLPTLVSANVTDECAVTGLVEFISGDDASEWARRMASVERVDRGTASREAQQQLRSAGYEVGEGAAKLRSLYMAIARRERLQAVSS